MKYYIIAGEASGDLHGANLMRGLAAEDSAARFRFWGGDKMAAVGGEENLAKHYRETSFFGIPQVLRNLKTIFGQMAECKRDIAAFAPDVVILIDYPSFNMRIAKWAHSRGFRVYYYIAPKVWAWKEFRVRQIRKYVDRLFVIFPFECDYFAGKGVKAVFLGNPTVDAVAERSAALPSREEYLQQAGLDGRPIVALLAGSRRNEIRDNLPDMVALSRRFPSYRFVVAGVSWIERSLYDEIIGGSDVAYVCDRTFETLAFAEAAVVTSGTATLETALMRVPEMVLYHVPKIYEILRPYVIKIPFISLVNINLGREAVREIVESRFDIAAAERELASILAGGEKRGRMLADFDALANLMGTFGSGRRVAADMVATLSGASHEKIEKL